MYAELKRPVCVDTRSEKPGGENPLTYIKSAARLTFKRVTRRARIKGSELLIVFLLYGGWVGIARDIFFAVSAVYLMERHPREKEKIMMGDAFVKMALTKDYVGLGKVGLAMAGVNLVCTAATAVGMMVVDAVAARPQAKKLSNPIVFKSHDEARAEAKKN